MLMMGQRAAGSHPLSTATQGTMQLFSQVFALSLLNVEAQRSKCCPDVGKEGTGTAGSGQHAGAAQGAWLPLPTHGECNRDGMGAQSSYPGVQAVQATLPIA